MPEFVLQVQDIPADGKDYSFPITPAWADQALKGSELRLDAGTPASLQLTATLSGAVPSRSRKNTRSPVASSCASPGGGAVNRPSTTKGPRMPRGVTGSPCRTLVTA